MSVSYESWSYETTGPTPVELQAAAELADDSQYTSFTSYSSVSTGAEEVASADEGEEEVRAPADRLAAESPGRAKPLLETRDLVPPVAPPRPRCVAPSVAAAVVAASGGAGLAFLGAWVLAVPLHVVVRPEMPASLVAFGAFAFLGSICGLVGGLPGRMIPRLAFYAVLAVAALGLASLAVVAFVWKSEVYADPAELWRAAVANGEGDVLVDVQEEYRCCGWDGVVAQGEACQEGVPDCSGPAGRDAATLWDAMAYGAAGASALAAALFLLLCAVMGTRNSMREMVSLEKRRYEAEGFNLDLTYILPRVIAMGFPASGREAMIRNSMKDTQRFLRKRHGTRIKVYNLCSEREYVDTSFPTCARFPFDDHNACSLLLIENFCRDATDFLSAHPENVVVVHCKAGKGRTGLFIVCLLMHVGAQRDVDKALEMFAKVRTRDGKGVTIPSQERFIRYYDRVLRHFGGHVPTTARATVVRVTMVGVPKVKGGSFVLQVVNAFGTVLHETKAVEARAGSAVEASFDLKVEVADSAKLVVKRATATGKHGRVCQLWIHPAFAKPKMRFLKKEIDDAVKDKKNKKFPPAFAMVVEFADIVSP